MRNEFFFFKMLCSAGILLGTGLYSCDTSSQEAGHVSTKGYNLLTITAGKGSASVEVADLNKDGYQDIVVANAEDSSIEIFTGNKNGTFTVAAGSPFYANRFPNDIVIADFNKDGSPDLGIANTEISQLTVFLGDGKAGFKQVAKSPFKVRSKPHTHGIAAGDFDGDGNLDLATDSWGVDSVILVFGDGKGNFGPGKFYKVGKRPYQRLRAADLNKDSKPDIVTTNLEGGNVTVLLNSGPGIFTEAAGSPFAAGDAPFGIAIGDVNGDDHPDLVVLNSPTITSENKGRDGLTILTGDGTGKFSPLKGSPFSTGKSPSRVAIGDLNGDGINDIAVTNYNDKSVTLFYMNKSGVYGDTLLTVGNRPDGIAIGDMNADGKNDIIVSNFDDHTIMVFFKN
jgi:FG-GAP-like repeat